MVSQTVPSCFLWPRWFPGFWVSGPFWIPKVPLNSLCFSLFPDVGFRSFLVLGFLGLVLVFGMVCPWVPFFSRSQCQAVSERGVRLPCFGLAVLVPRGLVGGKAFLCNPFSLGSRPCDLRNSLVSPAEPVNLTSGPELGTLGCPSFPPGDSR